MFTSKPVTETALDEAIEDALRELKGHEAHSESYAQIVDQLTSLYAIQDTKKDRLSKDTLAMVAANLAGIIMIVGHERAHIVTSKAIQFIGKWK